MVLTHCCRAVVGESLAQFHKGDSECGPGKLSSNAAKSSKLLFGGNSLQIIILRSSHIGWRGRLNAEVVLLTRGESVLFINWDLVGNGLGLGDLGLIDGVGDIHRRQSSTSKCRTMKCAYAENKSAIARMRRMRRRSEGGGLLK